MKLEDYECVAGLQLAAATGLCAAPLPWASWLATEGAPAWVQALGSILAIIAAVAISAQQTRATRQVFREQLVAQELRDRQLLDGQRAAALALMVAAADRMDLTVQSLRSPLLSEERIQAVIRSFEGVEGMLKAFPVHLIADPEGVWLFARGIAGVEVITGLLEMNGEVDSFELRRVAAVRAFEQSALSMRQRATEFAVRFRLKMNVQD